MKLNCWCACQCAAGYERGWTIANTGLLQGSQRVNWQKYQRGPVHSA